MQAVPPPTSNMDVKRLSSGLVSDCCDAPTDVETYHGNKTYHVCTECGKSFCGYHELKPTSKYHWSIKPHAQEKEVTIDTRLEGYDFEVRYDDTRDFLILRMRHTYGVVEAMIPYQQAVSQKGLVEAHQRDMIHRMRIEEKEFMMKSHTVASAPPKKEAFWAKVKEDPHAKNPF